MKLLTMLLLFFLVLVFKTMSTDSTPPTCKEAIANPSILKCYVTIDWKSVCEGKGDDHIVVCVTRLQSKPAYDNQYSGDEFASDYSGAAIEPSQKVPYCMRDSADENVQHYYCNDKNDCNGHDRRIPILNMCNISSDKYTVCDFTYPLSSLEIKNNNKTIACIQRYSKQGDGSWNKMDRGQHLIIDKDEEVEKGIIKCDQESGKSNYMARCHGKDCWQKINEPDKVIGICGWETPTTTEATTMMKIVTKPPTTTEEAKNEEPRTSEGIETMKSSKRKARQIPTVNGGEDDGEYEEVSDGQGNVNDIAAGIALTYSLFLLIVRAPN